MEWPYPICYGEEEVSRADVLVLGGGLAGCFAAISAAKKGAKVILVDKSPVKRSGSAGSGIDHWMDCPGNPGSKLTPEEYFQSQLARGVHINPIANYITARESWDALLELEQMGMKIRDSQGEFEGADFRDEKTQLLYAYDYVNRNCIRIWGTGMKPALYKECRRLGVQIFERVISTGLLTDGEKPGANVIGATGVNTHTGKFYIFPAKATVLCTSGPGRLWVFSTEYIGFSGSQFFPATNSGDGASMAWKAGAEFVGLEISRKGFGGGGGFAWPPYGVGNPRNTWFACNMVDENGKEIPWVDRDNRILKTIAERYRPAPGQKMKIQAFGGFGSNSPRGAYETLGCDLTPEVYDRIKKGEYTLPLYADLSSMPEHERRAIFGLMIGQEGKTNIPVYYTLTQAGFDPEKDMLQYYEGSWYGVGAPQWLMTWGGLMVDWDLKANVEGLYAGGQIVAGAGGAAGACCTGRYAGRKAADYAFSMNETEVNRSQIENEKARVSMPVNRKSGMDWKEFEAGIARVMQEYCGVVKTEKLLDLGLKWIDEIKEAEATELYARNPHELMRTIEALSILTLAEATVHSTRASLEERGKGISSVKENESRGEPFRRPKPSTTCLADGGIRVGDPPHINTDDINEIKQTYEAHCGL
jgi:succinate dehydrogenase/fumarate reductase flavoprotein subunit